MAANIKVLESRINEQDAAIADLRDQLQTLNNTVTNLLALVQANSVGPVQVSTKGGGKVGVTYLIHSVPVDGIQPQARKCMALAAAKFGLNVVIEERDLIAYLRSEQANISANQDAWSKVFCFYRARLVERGELTWNK